MKKKIRFTDAVLVLLGIGTVVFIVRTFQVFVIVGSEPSALVAGYFSFATAEAAILWRIYESKRKRKKEETVAEDFDVDIDGDPNEAETPAGGEG